MRPYLRDGLLCLALTKPEQRKIESAMQICEVIARLDPIDPELKEAASGLRNRFSAVLVNTGCVADKE
jgi:hypothetical protein